MDPTFYNVFERVTEAYPTPVKYTPIRRVDLLINSVEDELENNNNENNEESLATIIKPYTLKGFLQKLRIYKKQLLEEDYRKDRIPKETQRGQTVYYVNSPENAKILQTIQQENRQRELANQQEEQRKRKQIQQEKNYQKWENEASHQGFVRKWFEFLKSKYPDVPTDYSVFYPQWETYVKRYEQEVKIAKMEKIGEYYVNLILSFLYPSHAEIVAAALAYAAEQNPKDDIIQAAETLATQGKDPYTALNEAFTNSPTYGCTIDTLLNNRFQCNRNIEASYLEAAREVTQNEDVKTYLEQKATEALDMMKSIINSKQKETMEFTPSGPVKKMTSRFPQGMGTSATQIAAFMEKAGVYSKDQAKQFSDALNAYARIKGIGRNTVTYGGRKRTRRIKKTKSNKRTFTKRQ